jgi:photosystem II stability/assembly factor-like uncharacterized protein
MKRILILLPLLLLALACSLVTPAIPTAPASSAPENVQPTQAPQTSPQATPTATHPTRVRTPEPPREVVAGPQIVHLYMQDARNGWAISQTQLLQTSDGGATWVNVSLPGGPTLGYGAQVYLTGAGSVWVLTSDNPADPRSQGHLFHSGDNGRSWTSNLIPFSSASLAFVDDSQAWALVGLGVGAGSNAVAIYQTSDGGITWTQVYTNDPNKADSGDSLPLGGLKAGLAAYNMQTAWVSGTTYAPGEIYLFRSDDGGQTWFEQHPELSSRFTDAMIAIDSAPIFIDAQTGFLPVRMYGQDTSELNLYTTVDGGITWTPSSSPVPNGSQADILSASEAVVWDGQKFYQTSDGAQTWLTVTPNLGFGETFVQMDFVDLQNGWVLTADANNNRTLYQTSDGGATWIQLVP